MQERLHYIKSGSDKRSGEVMLIEHECQRLQAGISEACGYEPELVILDGAETDASSLASSLESGGLFASARLVVWKNPHLFKTSRRKSDAGEEEYLNILQGLLQDEAGDCTLAITHFKEKTPPKKQKSKKKGAGGAADKEGGSSSWLEKWLGKNAVVHDLQPLSQSEMRKWLTGELNSRKLGTDSDVINKLAASGQDMYHLSTLLDKLELLVAGRQLTGTDLDNELEIKQETSIFKLLDEMRARNTFMALKALAELMEQGESPQGIIAMMARDFKILARVKALQEKGRSEKEIADDIKQHPFVVGKNMKNSSRFSWPDMERLCTQLLATDIALKNSSMNERLLLETLIVQYGKAKR